ncbi:MAG: hypothetical protein OHK0013_50230 [Sandaracinaceae bacterium]
MTPARCRISAGSRSARPGDRAPLEATFEKRDLVMRGVIADCMRWGHSGAYNPSQSHVFRSATGSLLLPQPSQSLTFCGQNVATS